ncbi:DUF885 domain-containing protein [Nocardioides nitrophenolicus]|uniref:DUF885 domain-containing protein n=1 Tax=Nocardioides nitrophenolicus TaxID=60489 RepID=UPI00195BD7E5|nr:DUF885 domain-containing protein [Nocardioides nitrophenolicus]MBM7518527.1 hypothetical protein [Nocardioides nitrophenolicus]
MPISEADEPHPVAELAFAADPIAASEAGDRRREGELGEVDRDALADQRAARRRLLAEAERAAPPDPGTRAWLEHQVLLAELRRGAATDERIQVASRVPYWYAERLGSALSTVMVPGDASAADALLSRLRRIPGHLDAARANLGEDVPRVWAEMGETAARGLAGFLATAVPEYAVGLPPALAGDVAAAALAAGPAVEEFADFSGALAERATGRWQAGTAYVDLLLREVHHLDLDAAQLMALGRERVDSDEAALVAFAAARDPRRDWREQIEAIKDDHPESAGLLDAYGAATRAVRRHTAEAGLLSLPEGEECVLDWVPAYRRESLPLGEMAPSAPYSAGLRSEFRITPTDPRLSAERRRGHARENSHVFIASIAGHETYPGHHLQAVHHKLGTERGSVLRFVQSPQFVEGWGLYVEDLLEESGFMADDGVRLFKRRNALWRALRIVIDVGLHTGTLSEPEAVALLVERAGMEQHLAAGEVRRYLRHDNPTYPSSYVLGRDALHAVRAEARARAGGGFRLQAFHDELLSHGSPPVALLAAVMRAAGGPSAR